MNSDISVTWRTWTQGRTISIFTDWFDFADWLKQKTLQGHTVTIYGWKYIEKKKA